VPYSEQATSAHLGLDLNKSMGFQGPRSQPPVEFGVAVASQVSGRRQPQRSFNNRLKKEWDMFLQSQCLGTLLFALRVSTWVPMSPSLWSSSVAE
jgi:hypothetical protein